MKTATLKTVFLVLLLASVVAFLLSGPLPGWSEGDLNIAGVYPLQSPSSLPAELKAVEPDRYIGTPGQEVEEVKVGEGRVLLVTGRRLLSGRTVLISPWDRPGKIYRLFGKPHSATPTRDSLALGTWSYHLNRYDLDFRVFSRDDIGPGARGEIGTISLSCR